MLTVDFVRRRALLLDVLNGVVVDFFSSCHLRRRKQQAHCSRYGRWSRRCSCRGREKKTWLSMCRFVCRRLGRFFFILARLFFNCENFSRHRMEYTQYVHFIMWIRHVKSYYGAARLHPRISIHWRYVAFLVCIYVWWGPHGCIEGRFVCKQNQTMPKSIITVITFFSLVSGQNPIVCCVRCASVFCVLPFRLNGF